MYIVLYRQYLFFVKTLLLKKEKRISIYNIITITLSLVRFVGNKQVCHLHMYSTLEGKNK